MTTPPTPSQAKTREEWEKRICSIVDSLVTSKSKSASGAFGDSIIDADDADQKLFRFLDAIMSLQASESKLRSDNQELYQSLCSTNTQYGQLEEAEKELRAEVQRLRAIKSEWESMIGPIFDFCHDSENGKSLGLRLGDQIHVHILKMLQEKARQPK